MKPVMSADELNSYLVEVFPEIFEHVPDFCCTLVAPGRTVVEIRTDKRHIRAGGTVSGPTLFTLADMGGYCCVLSHVGRQALAVTTNLNINFMRKAAPQTLVADSRILKLGRQLMVFETTITVKGSPDPVAHATGTYAIPPARK